MKKSMFMAVFVALSIMSTGITHAEASEEWIATDTLSVGYSPTAVIVSPDGDYAYVTNWEQSGYQNKPGSVAVIHALRSRVAAKVDVGRKPQRIAISPDGDFLYVINTFSSPTVNNTISVLSTSDNSVTDTIDAGVGTVLKDVVVSRPNGDYLYLTNCVAGTAGILVLRTSDNTLFTTIDVGDYAENLAISPDGDYLYVTNQDSPFISVVRTSDHTRVSQINAGTDVHAWDIAVTPDGNYLYVTDSYNKSVVVIRISDGSVEDTIALESGNPKEVALAMSPDGDYVYAAVASDHMVSVIDTATNSIIQDIPVEMLGMGGPNDIAVTPNGETGESIYAVGYYLATIGLRKDSYLIDRGPYVQSITQNSAVIMWKMLEPRDMYVEYGTTPALGQSTPVCPTPDPDMWWDEDHESLERTEILANIDKYGEMPIDGLTEDTTYYYRITDGNGLESAIHEFKTNPPDTETNFSFIAFSDFGWDKDPQLDYDPQRLVAQKISEHISEDPVALFLAIGDVSQHAGGDSYYQTGVFDVYNDTGGIPTSGCTDWNWMSSIPMYPCIGNHDTSEIEDPPGQPTTQPSLQGLDAYPVVFALPASSSGTERYYSFDYGNVHFVALNNYEDDFELGWGTGNYADMIAWLEDDLATNDRQWTVVYFHQMVYNSPSDTAVHAWPVIFSNYGVDLVFTGHSHLWSRSYPLEAIQGEAQVTIVDPPEEGRGVVYVNTGEAMFCDEMNVTGPSGILEVYTSTRGSAYVRTDVTADTLTLTSHKVSCTQDPYEATDSVVDVHTINKNDLPVVTVDATVNGQRLPDISTLDIVAGAVQFHASATDSDGLGFDVFGNGAQISYAWDFGGASVPHPLVAFSPNPLVTFLSEGTYDLTLYVFDSLGAYTAKHITVNATPNDPPVVTVDATVSGDLLPDISTLDIAPGTIQFHANATDSDGLGFDVFRNGSLVSYMWLLDGGTPSHPLAVFSGSPWVTFSSPRTYNVAVIVYDSLGVYTVKHVTVNVQ